jgi:flavin reductase (DIM6/NTAB) family NADH-FMN oxidoreductase RutF
MQMMDYSTVMPDVMAQIRTNGGAFLTALAGEDVNTMTIGWATIGFIWGRPIMSVLVRKTRHTFGIIEKAADFSVSVPLKGMKKELEFCGTKSGKTRNKYAECGLNLIPSVKAHTPVIDCAGIHYECRIVYKSPVDPANLVEEYRHLYPEKDYHTVYYGEILQCYLTKEEITNALPRAARREAAEG